MDSVTGYPTTSIGSPLDLRIRREARKSKAFLQSAKMSRFDFERTKDSDPMATTVVENKIVTPSRSEAENVQDLANWLNSMATFNSCGRTIEQLEGIKVRILPSAVSKEAERFDPMSVVDDEFYTYKGN